MWDSTRIIAERQFLVSKDLLEDPASKISLRISLTELSQQSKFSVKRRCHELFYSVFFFFTKQLLLVPLDLHREDFECFRIFEEIFIYIIDFG